MVSLLIASVVVASAFAREPMGELRRDLADLSAGASAKAEAAIGREGGLSVQVPASSTPAIEVAAPGMTQQLELNDGTRAIGRVESVQDGRFTFRTTAGVAMEVEIAMVRSLSAVTGTVVNGEFWPTDSNPTRLFFAPTGRSLRKGEAYFGVYEVLLPFVQYGVTDRISIGGGTPLFFGGGSDQPFWFTPKVRVLRSQSTDLSVGVLHFVNMGDASVGIAYAVITEGTSDRAVTIGAGYAYSSHDRNRAGALVAMLGGEKRVSRRMKLVTENYWFNGVGLDKRRRALHGRSPVGGSRLGVADHGSSGRGTHGQLCLEDEVIQRLATEDTEDTENTFLNAIKRRSGRHAFRQHFLCVLRVLCG